MPKEETLSGARSFDIGATLMTHVTKMTAVAASKGRRTRARHAPGTDSKGCRMAARPP